jgi:hypothetical protein
MKRSTSAHQPTRSPLTRAVAALAAVLGSSMALAQTPANHNYQALAKADEFWSYFDDYCTECHNFDDYFGGVDFSTAFPTDVAEDALLYENVVKKLNGRMMPPPNRIRPPEARTDAFVAWLESYLDEAAADREDVQHVAVHRLNRKEYANAIRDLFGLEIKPEELLPADDTSDGFDNIAEALKVSPAFINQYVSAARVVAEQVVGDPTPNLGSTFYEHPETLPTRAEGGGSQQFHVEGLPLGTRGGMVVEHWFPVDGEYSVSVGDFNLHAWMYNIEFENTLLVTIDGKEVYRTVLGGDKDRIALDLDQGPPMDDINGRTKDIRFSTSAGPHKVGVTFLRRSFAESDDRLQHFIPGAVQDRILSIPSIEVRGPYLAGEISSTPTRDRLFSCYPQSADETRNCAADILANVATRAYRRPLDDADLQPIMAFFDQGNEEGGFEEGLRRGITRTLASPSFLYRAEVPGNLADNESVFAISSVDLASRLSFFLWSSIPDDELLEVAVTDQLKDPGVLEAQVRRMLADPRSKVLAENFAHQWLHLGKLSEINPDPVLFPYAAGAGDLRPDFQQEIALFIDSIFREDASVLRLLDASHTYLNERIALHYGINNVRGNRFRRVELEDPNRHGLLGKGGVLMATAYPNRTSPVLRGAWILETIMGTPPPVPPPDVEDLAENEAGKPASSVRERLERHRENPTCNSCHSVMDPLGFALDNFDPTGRWRNIDRDTGMPIDASGIMPNGSTVNGPIELRKALLSRPQLFAQALTEKLMIYALGRSLEPQDMPTVRALVRQSAEQDYRFSSIVLGIVNTEQFRKNRIEVSGGAVSNGIAMHERN